MNDNKNVALVCAGLGGFMLGMGLYRIIARGQTFGDNIALIVIGLAALSTIFFVKKKQ